MTLVVFSQFLGVVWNTMESTRSVTFGRAPSNPLDVIPGSNDEPYSDRNLVCMAQGRTFAPMQLSEVLSDPKLAPVVDSTGTSISGYRVIQRETMQLDFAVKQHYSQVCERIDYALEAIQDSCTKMGYNVTRDLLTIVDDIFSDTTKQIPRALPILIMPFWDNALPAHYAIPGWDGMACLFRLDGQFAILDETASVMRGAPRSIRETKTVEWLGKPGGVWRNGWYEDGSGQRWSSDMMTTDPANAFGIKSRQFDVRLNQEIDCLTAPVPRECRDFPAIEKWGQQSKSWDQVDRFNAFYISNGTHFGHFIFEATLQRLVENKYSLETFISNVSVISLLFRWFVSMAVMVKSFRHGLAPLQSSGIGCMSSSRTFNALPIVLLPRLKMTMAAFWTVGCEFQGAQRALGEAWFAMYPAIVELMLWYYSLINIVAKIAHRRVDDVLFGPTVFAFTLLHYYRYELAFTTLLNVDGRVISAVPSEAFDELNLIDLFSPSIALQMNGKIKVLFYTKLVVLALNLLPLVFSENVSRSGNKLRSYRPCEVEKTLALRASNIGGLGLSTVYATIPSTVETSTGPRIPSTTNKTRPGIRKVCKQSSATSVTPVMSFNEEIESRAPSLATVSPPRHVLVAFELDRLGYLVYGGKYLITYDDWYILTSMAPLRIVENLWNHRVSVFDVTPDAGGYYVGPTARLCRLDDENLRSIPFYDITICSFR